MPTRPHKSNLGPLIPFSKSNQLKINVERLSNIICLFNFAIDDFTLTPQKLQPLLGHTSIYQPFRQRFCQYLQASFWPSTFMQSSGGQNMRQQIGFVVQHASWILAVLAGTHFECCMTTLIGLFKFEMLENKNKSTNRENLSKV